MILSPPNIYLGFNVLWANICKFLPVKLRGRRRICSWAHGRGARTCRLGAEPSIKASKHQSSACWEIRGAPQQKAGASVLKPFPQNRLSKVTRSRQVSASAPTCATQPHSHPPIITPPPKSFGMQIQTAGNKSLHESVMEGGGQVLSGPQHLFCIILHIHDGWGPLKVNGSLMWGRIHSGWDRTHLPVPDRYV